LRFINDWLSAGYDNYLTTLVAVHTENKNQILFGGLKKASNFALPNEKGVRLKGLTV